MTQPREARAGAPLNTQYNERLTLVNQVNPLAVVVLFVNLVAAILAFRLLRLGVVNGKCLTGAAAEGI